MQVHDINNMQENAHMHKISAGKAVRVNDGQ